MSPAKTKMEADDRSRRYIDGSWTNIDGRGPHYDGRRRTNDHRRGLRIENGRRLNIDRRCLNDGRSVIRSGLIIDWSRLESFQKSGPSDDTSENFPRGGPFPVARGGGLETCSQNGCRGQCYNCSFHIIQRLFSVLLDWTCRVVFYSTTVYQ